MTATDLSSVAAALVPYLNAVDAATLRLTCRACRAYVDGALTQLRPFALPNGGFHRLAVPPHIVYREAIKGSPAAAKLHTPFQDGGFQQLALCAPALRSLEAQCMARGCLDFKCLQGMSQLAALTLLEFPFSDAKALVDVARCKCLQRLRLQSCEVGAMALCNRCGEAELQVHHAAEPGRAVQLMTAGNVLSFLATPESHTAPQSHAYVLLTDCMLSNAVMGGSVACVPCSVQAHA